MTNYSNKEHFPITETTAYRQVLELSEEGRAKSSAYLALLRLEVVSDLKRKFSLSWSSRTGQIFLGGRWWKHG